ncbi:MAG: CRISPR-associated endonuclease Cas1 [Candidatus Heimdallarchaeaceae archaeon]
MVILLLTTHGTRLGKTKEMFKISLPGIERIEEVFPAEKVEEIVVECSASISTSAINLASKYAIPIIFTRENDIVSCLHPLIGHGSVLVRREQIRAYDDYRGVEFIKKLLIIASKNKEDIIKNAIRRQEIEENKAERMRRQLDGMEKLREKLDITANRITECRQEFFAIEAEITKRYFNCMEEITKGYLGFKGRTRRPAKDPVNALLNYGYAVLTAQIHKSVIIGGMEPYAGFLHTDRSGRASFVLDLIEIFRQPVIDKIVWKLVNKKMIKDKDFEENNGIRIKEETKKEYLEEIYEKIRKENVNYEGKKTSMKKIFVDQTRKIGKYFKTGKNKYLEGLGKWSI